MDAAMGLQGEWDAINYTRLAGSLVRLTRQRDVYLAGELARRGRVLSLEQTI
jgi:hypothetical protein